MHPSESTRRVFSVSELNQQSKQLLESAFPGVWVEGEVSNFSAPSSGHWYFSLKDSSAQIRCAMFRNRNLRAGPRPANGDHVLVRGSVSLYTARGDYQLIAETLEPAGLGALQRALEALKRRLAAEGLFDVAHKRALPAVPGHIAIITSPTGAALHDMLTVLRRRYPLIPVSVFPVPVQGEGAAARIAAAIELANRLGPEMEPPLDAMIVGRGGGSLEDLWAFNEEIVARAIHASRIPIVSAVGHETDFTLADLVADVRAPTPSAAAELLSPDRARLLDALESIRSRLNQRMLRALSARRQQLDWLSRRVRHPGSRLREQAQRLDDLEMRLGAACRQQLRDAHARFVQLRTALAGHAPIHRLTENARLLEQIDRRLRISMRRALIERTERLARQMQLLDSVSPLATLARGYAIVTDRHDRPVRDAASVAPGQAVRARLARGELRCLVEECVLTETPDTG